jgi:hypothetical protein
MIEVARLKDRAPIAWRAFLHNVRLLTFGRDERGNVWIDG